MPISKRKFGHLEVICGPMFSGKTEELIRRITKTEFTVCIKKTEFKLPFAILSTKKEKIMSIKEKPETSFLFNTGIYMLNKKIVDLIPKNK